MSCQLPARRVYFLRQQVETIRKELAKGEDNTEAGAEHTRKTEAALFS